MFSDDVPSTTVRRAPIKPASRRPSQKSYSSIIDLRLAGAQGGAFSSMSRKVPPIRDAARRTARRHIHVNTQLLSATDGHVVLSRCDEFDPNLIVWTTVNSANPAPACGVRQRRRTRYPTLRFSLTLLLVSLPWIVATPPRSFAPPVPITGV